MEHSEEKTVAEYNRRMATGKPVWGDCKRGGVFLLLPQPVAPLVSHVIQEKVPPCARRWDQITKHWWIHDNHIDKVEEVLRAHYPAYDPYEDAWK